MQDGLVRIRTLVAQPLVQPLQSRRGARILVAQALGELRGEQFGYRAARPRCNVLRLPLKSGVLNPC